MVRLMHLHHQTSSITTFVQATATIAQCIDKLIEAPHMLRRAITVRLPEQTLDQATSIVTCTDSDQTCTLYIGGAVLGTLQAHHSEFPPAKKSKQRDTSIQVSPTLPSIPDDPVVVPQATRALPTVRAVQSMPSHRAMQFHTCADFVAGAALCEPPCADVVAGAALCEPPCADFVAGAVLCEPAFAG